ncbi:hypothetical protein KUTeg_019556 [Tegillarca granosa]|uniref:Amino acid transporter transmembrane domain-containing protein n=1 Tax=Tegillarca granosa TaxID=220873 RepID=A0ABQ9EHZ6_TEGGR|nr:hypothetical protein KUTeg_019556 [Tegillarca granosa]
MYFTFSFIGSSWFSSVFLVVNAALGAGLLNFPDAYQQAGGVLVAVLIQAIFLVFVVCAIMILAYCSDIKQTATYQDVVLSVCGKNAQRCCAFSIMLYCFGTCITFLIIIGDQWEEFFLYVARGLYCDSHPWYMDRMTTISGDIIFIDTSTMLSKTNRLPQICKVFLNSNNVKNNIAIGVVGILYVVAIVTIKYFLPHDSPGPIKTKAALDCLWVDIWKMTPEDQELTEKRRRILVSSIWFLLTLVLAVFIPNIGVVIQILGAFAAIFIFIFPGMCLLSTVLNDTTDKWVRRFRSVVIFSCTFIILGAFIFGLTLSQSIVKDTSKGGVKADKSKYSCQN